MSDARLKRDIRDLQDGNGLSSILKLRPVNFRWKDAAQDKHDGLREGLIAQEVEKVMPLFVNSTSETRSIKLPDGSTEVVKNVKDVNYLGLIIPLVMAVQELNTANGNLRAEFEAYKTSHP